MAREGGRPGEGTCILHKIMFSLVRREALRLAVTVTVGALMVLSLAWWWPAQRELDTAVYRYAAWNVESDISATPADLGRIERDFGAGTVSVTSAWDASLTSDSGVSATVNAMVTFPSSTEFSYFPPAERVAFRPVSGTNWIDIDVRAASTLHLKPGDRVLFGGPETMGAKVYLVRGVYAVTSLGSLDMPSVVPSGEPLRDLFATHVGDGDRPTLSTALISQKSTKEVAQIFDGEFYRSRFRTEGYGKDVSIESRQDRLTYMEGSTSAGVTLVSGVSALSGVALFALIAREISVFATRAGRRVRVLRTIGAPRGGLAVAVGTIGALATVLGLILGSLFSYAVLNSGYLTAAFPPTLLPLFVGVSATACLLASAGAIGLAWRATALKVKSR